MFTSHPLRRLRWSAGAAEQSSPNRVPFKERHFSYSLEFWSQISAAGLKTDLRTVILTG